MAKFLKPCLGPGQWIVHDENGEPGLFTADPARVRRWAAIGKQMLSRNLKIPVIWEHTLEENDPSGLPMTDDQLLKAIRDRDATLTKYNAGFVTDFILDGDNLSFELDIPLPEDAAKVGTTVQAISPLIEDQFCDGDGREWRDSICHVALTNKPVIASQGEFRRIAASRRMSFVRLSRAWGGTVANKGGSQRDNDDSEDDDGDGVPNDQDAAPQKPGFDQDGDGDNDDDLQDFDISTFGDDMGDDAGGMDDQPVSPELIQGLQMHGMIIPADTTLGTLEQHLLTALHTSKATKNMAKNESLEMNGGGQGLNGQPNGQKQMPTQGLREESQVALSRRIQSLEESARKNYRVALMQRLNRVLKQGKLSVARHGMLANLVKSAKLSIGKDGAVMEREGINTALAVAEDTPPGTHFTQEQRGSEFQEADNEGFFESHEEYPATISEKAAKDLVAEMRKETGRS